MRGFLRWLSTGKVETPPRENEQEMADLTWALNDLSFRPVIAAHGRRLRIEAARRDAGLTVAPAADTAREREGG